MRACTYVEEAEELAAIVRRVVASRGAEAALVYQRFHQIVSCPVLSPRVLMEVLNRRQRPSQVIGWCLGRRASRACMRGSTQDAGVGCVEPRTATWFLRHAVCVQTLSTAPGHAVEPHTAACPHLLRKNTLTRVWRAAEPLPGAAAAAGPPPERRRGAAGGRAARERVCRRPRGPGSHPGRQPPAVGRHHHPASPF